MLLMAGRYTYRPLQISFQPPSKVQKGSKYKRGHTQPGSTAGVTQPGSGLAICLLQQPGSGLAI